METASSWSLSEKPAESLGHHRGWSRLMAALKHLERNFRATLADDFDVLGVGISTMIPVSIQKRDPHFRIGEIPVFLVAQPSAVGIDPRPWTGDLCRVMKGPPASAG